MLRILAVFVGILFIAFGVIGLLPEFYLREKLFGVLAINSANSFFSITLGVLALLSSFKSSGTARFFFLAAGCLFGAAAAYAFYDGGPYLFHLFAVNNANNWLHVIIAILFLYIGFVF